jgi:hypothetical protein
VDLGQAHDFTAITVAERFSKKIGDGPPDFPVFGDNGAFYQVANPILEHTFQIGHLERLPLGTPYPAQVERVKELVTHLKSDKPRLIVDATGVGRPVVDLMRKEGLEPVAVVITAGDTEAYADGFHRVPKRNLVSTGQVLLQSGRIKIHSSLPLADTLTKELLAFKVTITSKGNDTYGNDWRENPHDDLVLSTLLAAYWGEKPGRRPVQPSVSLF